MAFLVYKKSEKNGKDILEATGEHYVLGGRNLIYMAWEKRGKPINKGWHVNADELIQIYSQGKNTYENLRLLIDFNPRSDSSIGIIELLDIYSYTYGDLKGNAIWTPMMLKMRYIMEEVFDKPISKSEKDNFIFKISREYGEKFIEFLYLQGELKKPNWGWGSNGRTNAAFILKEPLSYFKKFI